ncbi:MULTISPECIES: HDOD domain-containing protein [unclassified Modicisalibacter]|uniref:EAL and HDOD domain-containing protein n=1 Tax=unclassified Modicisalibacter TaxID=2679913 RepID=UPI001CCE7741|nr:MULTISPECIES: HDOD domain-containing protein [unclassified Modicisalibacter]MBZ9559192.1 HDOD domain-containing protein [Modicisalibacter sp. R2A 31.J]MBZ9576643.1 HDOD domain-containing protein [Modicisalibacter sp. MOD 31.J]
MHETPAVLFARQPIYDRRRELAGCELLFRPAPGATSAPFDGDFATRQVLLSAFTETSLRDVCENTPAFINFGTATLTETLPFPPGEMVIEVLETVPASAPVIAALNQHRLNGYRIALDDYRLEDSGHPLLCFADIVKLDYPEYSTDGLARVIAALRRDYPRVRLLAEKVETHEDFERCLAAGCDLFQGYFLARPAPVHGQHLPSDRLSVLHLLAELNRPDIGFNELSAIIRRDPFISVRLLKMAGSAYFSRSREITSVQMAVTLLGKRRILSLANLIALTRLDDKPHALRQLALARGELCQALADQLLDNGGPGFTVGLFSCLDAFFDRPLDQVLDELPLHDSLRRAILHHEGPLGQILATAKSLECGELDALDWTGLTRLGLTPNALSRAQRRAFEAVGAQR